MELNPTAMVKHEVDWSWTRFLFGTSWSFKRCGCGQFHLLIAMLHFSWERRCAENVRQNIAAQTELGKAISASIASMMTATVVTKPDEPKPDEPKVEQ